jgi:hypothetical protein
MPGCIHESPRGLFLATALILSVTSLADCRSRRNSDELIQVKFQADWYPQPEHGGFFDAVRPGDSVQSEISARCAGTSLMLKCLAECDDKQRFAKAIRTKVVLPSDSFSARIKSAALECATTVSRPH